jgi:hypothetical protein
VDLTDWRQGFPDNGCLFKENPYYADADSKNYLETIAPVYLIRGISNGDPPKAKRQVSTM